MNHSTQRVRFQDIHSPARRRAGFSFFGVYMRLPTPVEATGYAGSVVSIGASLTLTDIGIIVGIVTALLTFGFNAWYIRRKDRREVEEHAARMRALGGSHEL
ncbi:phage holin family protein [Cupriavidus gilardii]|uniref:phage holin family protein n=1 Tax=Cupriavidus gilardii TaxID=82541 RepID=UPI0021C0D14C|nr:phage holin family protein [Cupriavidus gilardii]MCT9017176.1 phage holin family protein [Cupriavidus gilardii]